MCGIAGFLTNTPTATESLHQQARKMSDAIRHRGPDGDGFWVDQEAGIALAHRRLAVVDITPSGDQPMISSCSNFVMVYNGEVYNAAEIASELENLQLKGSSDSEVILEAFSQWGIHKTLDKLIGMFAIALWDRSTRELILIRDRLGIKPVYWTQNDGTFLFGSELKALMQHPACPRKVNHDALAGFLRKCYINAPQSVFKGVHKLEPGCILTVRVGHEPVIEKYWSLDKVIENQSTPFTGSDEEAVDHLETLLKDAVSRRMISDVPLGAFLSGGVDSSTVAALMQEASNNPVKTFSIGFDIDEYNEAQHAADVARHLGTDHTELYVSSQDALDVIPQLTTMYDEPFADASQIPTYIVSKLTREHVTVALSGDGGDELFTGYERYFSTSKLRHILSQPQVLLNLEAKLLESISEERMDSVGRLLPSRLGKIFSGNKLHRLIPTLRDGHFATLYKRSVSYNQNPSELLLRGEEQTGQPWQKARTTHFNDKYSMMQYIDTLDYLPDDILTKVDRASMAVSLEARVPLIDHRVVEFSWTLPERMKVRDGNGKWILRNVLYKHVPRELVDRPKMGFGVPVGHWLKDPLKDWAEELLSPTALKETGILNPAPVRKMWKEHLTGQYDRQYGLWDILNIQSWAKNTGYEN